ncbi:hypothetical protein [Nocardia carnea]|uniref:hypothetical protein n=1 Tax=Nocardia carnea TaxID=37328 RepID=UPI002453D266|nr:hypothetical protein [Nocardia carnea]
MGLIVSRVVAVVSVVIVMLVAGPAGSAMAQTVVEIPEPLPGEQVDSTTYGWDETCNEIHDALSEIPLIGAGAGNVASAVCKAGNVAGHPGEAAEVVRSQLWDSTFGKLTEILLEGLGDALEWSMAWAWLPNDRILTGPDGGDATQSLGSEVNDYTRQLQVWLLAFSIAVSALRIGIARHHMASEHAEETFKMLARSTLTTWVAGTAILAGARMTDSLSSWILAEATDGDARGAAELMISTYRYAVWGPGLFFMVAIVGIFGALAMTVLTIIRQALLVVAVGIYPLTAAASGLGSGRQAFQKLGAWIIAFLLFKPIAALVYLIAFTTAADANASYDHGITMDSTHRGLVGIALLCSVAFVLPALVRLVSPALSAIGSGGGGATAAGAALGAAAVVATGGKALLARGAVAGGAGSAGFVTSARTPPVASGSRALPPGQSPKALPGPGEGSSGRTHPSSAGGPSGARGKTSPSSGLGGAGSVGRRINEEGEDVSGAHSGPSTGTGYQRRTDNGPTDIPR